MKKNEVIQALNRIDEFACELVEGNDKGEAELLAKDYNLVFNFIQSVTTKIDIPLSEGDCDELKEGKFFNWNFKGIDVHLFNENDVDNCKNLMQCKNCDSIFNEKLIEIDCESGSKVCPNCMDSRIVKYNK